MDAKRLFRVDMVFYVVANGFDEAANRVVATIATDNPVPQEIKVEMVTAVHNFLP